MPWQLSGGMQQRIAIASALAAHPAAAADGRAVRRARRDDPRAHAGRAAADLRRHRHHRRVRHPLDPGGGVPVGPRGRDVAAPGSDHRRDRRRPRPRPQRGHTRARPASTRRSPQVREALRRVERTARRRRTAESTTDERAPRSRRARPLVRGDSRIERMLRATRVGATARVARRAGRVRHRVPAGVGVRRAGVRPQAVLPAGAERDLRGVRRQLQPDQGRRLRVGQERARRPDRGHAARRRRRRSC